MNTIRILALAVAVFAFASAAQAHSALYMTGGAEAGFAHPLSGLDHLLTMIAVGVWAGLLGGCARWLVPAAFVVVMGIGAVLGANGIVFPGVETVIIVSLIATGTLIAARAQVSPAVAMALVGGFALFHGQAHGTEMPAIAAPVAYGIGFTAATVVLHGIGLFGAWALRASSVVLRAAGGAVAAVGLALVLTL